MRELLNKTVNNDPTRLQNLQVNKVALTVNNSEAHVPDDPDDNRHGARLIMIKSQKIQEIICKGIIDQFDLSSTNINIEQISNIELWEQKYVKFMEKYNAATFTPFWYEGDYYITYNVSSPSQGVKSWFGIDLISMDEIKIGIYICMYIDSKSASRVECIEFSTDKFTTDTAKQWISENMRLISKGGSLNMTTDNELKELVLKTVGDTFTTFQEKFIPEMKATMEDLISKSVKPVVDEGKTASPEGASSDPAPVTIDVVLKSEGFKTTLEDVVKGAVGSIIEPMGIELKSLGERLTAYDGKSNGTQQVHSPADVSLTTATITKTGNDLHDLMQSKCGPGEKVVKCGKNDFDLKIVPIDGDPDEGVSKTITPGALKVAEGVQEMVIANQGGV